MVADKKKDKKSATKKTKIRELGEIKTDELSDKKLAEVTGGMTSLTCPGDCDALTITTGAVKILVAKCKCFKA